MLRGFFRSIVERVSETVETVRERILPHREREPEPAPPEEIEREPIEEYDDTDYNAEPEYEDIETPLEVEDTIEDAIADYEPLDDIEDWRYSDQLEEMDLNPGGDNEPYEVYGTVYLNDGTAIEKTIRVYHEDTDIRAAIIASVGDVDSGTIAYVTWE